jgi:hypothetical protein
LFAGTQKLKIPVMAGQACHPVCIVNMFFRKQMRKVFNGYEEIAAQDRNDRVLFFLWIFYEFFPFSFVFLKKVITFAVI